MQISQHVVVDVDLVDFVVAAIFFLFFVVVTMA